MAKSTCRGMLDLEPNFLFFLIFIMVLKTVIKVNYRQNFQQSSLAMVTCTGRLDLELDLGIVITPLIIVTRGFPWTMDTKKRISSGPWEDRSVNG
jgi:hypothetical protein